ncbi:sensor histidine kinase [Thermicanus aegyptius]|uniref:sensor histidine kinase n=1 Tax=Thermicanus aegyptius TaxID=94009 RepID=UPI000347D780|nr:HAMP domain-containing sensor histidine kinase [Thermicanus aegyptius]
MFRRLRHRLTLLFTFLLMIFLLAFMGITYFSFSYFLYHDRYVQVMGLVRNELGDHSELFVTDAKGKSDHGVGKGISNGKGTVTGVKGEEKENEDVDEREGSISGDGTLKGEDHRELRLINGDEIRLSTPSNSFYYLFSEEGRFLHGDESLHELRKEIFQKLNGWVPREEEYRLMDFTTGEGATLHFLVGGREVIQEGKPLGLVYAGVDITPEKNALDRLMVLLGGLSLLFLLISYILGQFMAGRAMRPIHQSFQRQREFVADASHELRSPLSVLQASLDVIEAEEGEKFSSFSHQILQDMKDETRRMGRLTQDLLTLARADSDAIQLEKTDFNLAEMGRSVIRTFQSMAKQKEIVLDFQGPESLFLYADEERMRQLLTILLDNAVKYTPKQGKVHLQMEESGRTGRKKVVIQVRDTGIGIPAEKLPRIFDRFYRVDKVRSREQGGAGLGLSIAKWIVEAHDGEIRVESKEGEGTTFTVLLPLSPSPSPYIDGGHLHPPST